MNTWQLQEAKARLSEVIKKAAKEGPQSITVHGESTAVIISQEEYEPAQASPWESSNSCVSRRCTDWNLA